MRKFWGITMDCGSAVSGDWRLAARRIPGERGTSVPWLWSLRLCNWTYARVLTPLRKPVRGDAGK